MTSTQETQGQSRMAKGAMAIRLAALGIPLFPVSSKVPMVTDWQMKATTEVAKIAEWNRKYNDPDYAMPTGELSGIWVLDIDTKKGKRGIEFFNEKLKRLEGVTTTQTTPSGGFHLFFSYTEKIRNAVDIFGPESGVDIRGDGGYVVICPSDGYKFTRKFPSGVTETPEWLWDMVRPSPEVKPEKRSNFSGERIEEHHLRNVLFTLDPEDHEFVTRDGWQRVMRSVHSASHGEDYGKTLFTEWSLQHPGPWEKDPEQEIERDWASYDHTGAQTFGTLCHFAQQRGLVIRNTAPVTDTMPVENDQPRFMVTPKGKIKPNAHNALEYLSARSLGDKPNPFYQLFVYDEFRHQMVWFRPPEWDKRIKPGQPISDTDITNLTAKIAFCHKSGAVDFSKNMLRDAVEAYAREHRTHPIQNYLKSLVWDREERLSTWLIDFLGLDNNAYTRGISRGVLISAIARVMRPGETVQNMLVIEGRQGCQKSRFVEAMGFNHMSDRKWSSAPNLNLQGLGKGDTSAVTDVMGTWIIEVAEMMSISAANEMQVKKFITTSSDRATLKWEKFAQDYPRQFIMIGTINPYGEGRYIKDHTGARRYWPVFCPYTEENPIDVEGLRAVMDQLYAEAFVAYKAGEKWYLTGEALKIAQEEQGKRIQSNDRMHDVAQYFTYGMGRKLTKVHTAQVARDIWVNERKFTQYMKDTIADYLKGEGWVFKKGIRINDKVTAGWQRSDDTK